MADFPHGTVFLVAEEAFILAIQGVAALAAEILESFDLLGELALLAARPVGRVTLGVGVPGTLRNTRFLVLLSRLTFAALTAFFPAAELTKTTPRRPVASTAAPSAARAPNRRLVDTGPSIAPPSTSFAETGPPVLSFWFSTTETSRSDPVGLAYFNPTEDPRCPTIFLTCHKLPYGLALLRRCVPEIVIQLTNSTQGDALSTPNIFSYYFS